MDHEAGTVRVAAFRRVTSKETSTKGLEEYNNAGYIFMLRLSLRLFREHVNPQEDAGGCVRRWRRIQRPWRTQTRADGHSRVNTRRGTARFELGECKVLLMQPHDREIARWERRILLLRRVTGPLSLCWPSRALLACRTIGVPIDNSPWLLGLRAGSTVLLFRGVSGVEGE